MANNSTLIQALDSKTLQARVNFLDVRPFQYASHFPLYKRIGFNWGTIANVNEGGMVAADIVAENSTTKSKRRPLIEVAQGSIPEISIRREMDTQMLHQYQTALSIAGGDADATKFVQYWGGDVDFCFNGVQSELEHLAWALVSNGAELAITKDNNAYFATEASLNYQVDDEQKAVLNWTDAKGADIIGDLAKTVRDAKARGFNPKVAFMSLNQFYKLATNEQVQKATATILGAATGYMAAPDMATVNQVFARTPWLNGLQVVVVDQDIVREHIDGSRTSANPFADDRIVLAEGSILGSTQYDIEAYHDGETLRAERGHTVVKKFSTSTENNSPREITVGQAFALPVLDTAYRNIYIRTDNTSW